MATSTLNPNAPIFVPLSYRKVEDFSDQWWDLVSSSPWFRDYWLRECFHDSQFLDFSDFSISPVAGDDDDSKPPTAGKTVTKQEEKGRLDLVSLGVLKWRKPRGAAEILAATTKYGQKAPKIVNVKMNPKTIKQPR